MNDLKYVVINLICFLMMSCTQVIFGSDEQAIIEIFADTLAVQEDIVELAAQEAISVARSEFSQAQNRRRAREQEQNLPVHVAASMLDAAGRAEPLNNEHIRPRHRRPRLDDFIAFEGTQTPLSSASSQDGVSPRGDVPVPSRQEVDNLLFAVNMSESSHQA